MGALYAAYRSLKLSINGLEDSLKVNGIPHRLLYASAMGALHTDC